LAFTPTSTSFLHGLPAIYFGMRQTFTYGFVLQAFSVESCPIAHVFLYQHILVARDNEEDTDHESGDPYSIVEPPLDPEPQFDINPSGGHMSLPSPRLKARRV
jgi:hypothetical protein